MADGFVTAQISFPEVKLQVESECCGSVFIALKHSLHSSLTIVYLEHDTSSTSISLLPSKHISERTGFRPPDE